MLQHVFEFRCISEIPVLPVMSFDSANSYRVTHQDGKNLQLTWIRMFRHPTWAVGSSSSGPTAA